MEIYRYRSAQQSVAISSIVDALEENEGYWVGRCGWSKRVSQVLDCEMSVADDLSIRKILWRRIVGGLRVGEGACFETFSLH